MWKTEAFRTEILRTEIQRHHTYVYPAHDRPVLTKQLKCQSLHCGMAARTELMLPVRRSFLAFVVRQSSAARISADAESTRQKPESRLFP